ncbi:LANO_0G03041g1_1 [Lachancea nothofagi CBS 11611]|uniref:LANO_0G00144g1_1 n=1 Tax=Lachancea nothofagi CBS 11611 TaxID=1266666 RepID=A0A1G4KE35_9SACH|nr:LANO_0G00144g1_1 [Lachancea nothofagi CBS 11611]SCV03252.1 LANO_0G03041g1_1 [Lachancea nothofagi CBS 11611]
MTEVKMTRGFMECEIPKKYRKITNKRLNDVRLVRSQFPCSGTQKNVSKTCQFITDSTEKKIVKISSNRSKNKFILMRSLLHSVVQKISSCSSSNSRNQSSVEEVSKIASWLWKKNQGGFQSYHQVLAVFEENRTVNNPTISLKKLTEAIGRECIPSTYSYETLTNAADTTAMESKKTYKAFCGRFSLKEATRRVRKKKPIQTFALRSANIEDVFLI